MSVLKFVSDLSEVLVWIFWGLLMIMIGWFVVMMLIGCCDWKLLSLL